MPWNCSKCETLNGTQCEVCNSPAPVLYTAEALKREVAQAVNRATAAAGSKSGSSTSSAPKKTGSGLWTAYVIMSCAVVAIAFVGWNSSVSNADKLTKRVAELTEAVRSRDEAITQRDILLKKTYAEYPGLKAKLERLKKRLVTVANDGPVSASDIRLGSNNYPQTNTTSFPRSVKYVTFSVKLTNNLNGVQDIKGTLGVKYFSSSGYLETGEVEKESRLDGYTFGQPVTISDSQVVTRGWGNPTGYSYSVGQHRVEFWWAGRKLGEARFSIY